MLPGEGRVRSHAADSVFDPQDRCGQGLRITHKGVSPIKEGGCLKSSLRQHFSFLSCSLQQVILSVTMIPLRKPDHLYLRSRFQKGAKRAVW